jgi:hypothetical protein
VSLVGLAQQGAVLVSASAVVVSVLVWLVTRAWDPAVPVLLELLLAAGLLRLSAAADWRAIAAAAAIVAIRTLVTRSRRATAASRPA